MDAVSVTLLCLGLFSGIALFLYGMSVMGDGLKKVAGNKLETLLYGLTNGPIQAAVFGWVPVLLWVLIGGIFFGGVHDYGALFASLRHKGQSIGEVIADTMGSKAKKLFIVFAYLTLILVVAAFGSIVANTFKAAYTESGAVDVAASSANATTAMISILFIVLAVVFGFMVYRRNVLRPDLSEREKQPCHDRHPQSYCRVPQQ